MTVYSVRHLLFAMESIPSYFPATTLDMQERLVDLYFDEDDDIPFGSDIQFLARTGMIRDEYPGWVITNLGYKTAQILRSGGHAPAYKIID